MFNAVAECMPETRFLWIGDGELRDELKSGNIEVTGWVSREEALRRAVNADVFLLTSLWEGLPISLLEAMYLQKLCVVSDVIGNRDVIRSGENGFVCRTAEEYKAAILTPLPERLTAAAYRDIITHYNTTEMGRQYAELYENAIAQRDAKA
jgi:glycosyltransferase involved in cell wall biosynthesis